MADASTVIFWVVAGAAFVIGALIVGLGWRYPSTYKRFKLILSVLFCWIVAYGSGSMALGQGSQTRADSHFVYWGIYVDTLAFAFATAAVVWGLTGDAVRAAVAGFFNLLAYLPLVFAATAIGTAVWFNFIWAIVLTVALCLWLLLFVGFDRAERPDVYANVLPYSLWVRLATAFLLLAQCALYVPSSQWLDSYPNDWLQVLVWAIIVVLLHLVVAFVFFFVDLYIDSGIVTLGVGAVAGTLSELDGAGKRAPEKATPPHAADVRRRAVAPSAAEGLSL